MSCTTEVAKSPTSATFPPFRLRQTDEWEAITLPRLRTLLRHAEYSKEDSAYTVRFTKQNILRPGFFGPFTRKPTWKSYLTDDHTPIEFSIDIGEQGTKVRFAIEPLSMNGDDPYNIRAPIAYLQRVQQSVPDVNLDWFTALGDKLFINERTPNAAADVQSAQGLTQVLCAMDFNGQGSALIKAYILLDATRRAFGEAETIRRVDQAADQIGVGAQWTALRRYVDRAREAGLDNGARVEFISVDCVAKDKGARFKPYVRFSHLTKRDFLRHVRLDQESPSSEMLAYEALCGQLWDAFCDDDDLLRVQSTKDLDERTHGAIFYYEMHANSASSAIQPKVYLPVRHMLSNDGEIGKRIDEFLAQQHLKPRGWYSSLLEKFTTHRALSQGQGIQTMLGIALKKGKPSVSVYLNPEAFTL